MMSRQIPPLGITHGAADLVAPPDDSPSLPLRYGVGVPFQVAPRLAAVICNVRMLGAICIDFESGADVILFDHPDRLDSSRAVTLTRSHREIHPISGEPVIMAKNVSSCGFVPLGAHLADGRPHPHAGSGFALATARGFHADMSERLSGEKCPEHRYLELSQFRFDGTTLAVTRQDRLGHAEVLPGLVNLGRGLGVAIPDAEDLLWGMGAKAQGGQTSRGGVARWRYGAHGWRPVSWTPVTPEDTSIEPNIHRDVDGSLLFGARAIAHDQGDAVSLGLRAWRSSDGGATWEQVISAGRVRASTPVVLNQAGDGTPFLCANPWDPQGRTPEGKPISIWSQRQRLMIWPLDAARRALLEPVLIRDTTDFGPPPQGRLWYADHAMANTVQLGDGAWHTLLMYRVRESQGTREHVERPTPATGSYMEEVTSAGESLPRWQF